MPSEQVSKLTLTILPSEGSNDHQVRPSIDGVDLLGDRHIGLDPVRFFEQPEPKEYLVVGRCTCGEEGCSSRAVFVRREGDAVVWEETHCHPVFARFDSVQYAAEMARAAMDTSWEDAGRRAERLVTVVLKGKVLRTGETFQWVSTRCGIDCMTISLQSAEPGRMPTHLELSQRVVRFPWDEAMGDAITDHALEFWDSLDKAVQ